MFMIAVMIVAIIVLVLSLSIRLYCEHGMSETKTWARILVHFIRIMIGSSSLCVRANAEYLSHAKKYGERR
ncbi:hypothetical protein HY11_14235 [Hyphomonas pacifica]|nr:hypothetical protein HY11_14235 [Hyphomonas pacifica]